ncbi:hypothetical protein EHQ94_11105 [Leptospira meyeri]|uniref:hypothetical protein n=1 Tax=Leptospira meyeri TaxID=29508 RepID=UPI001083DC51|nr:hypothetical protein [Leptospira meyeri]TGM66137.1 hypothetical protein EHQ94_11105 [Leptospira meyeri]
MKNEIISQGWLGALKWNGRLFDSGGSNYSRIILPIGSEIADIENMNFLTESPVKFNKKHKIGNATFSEKSLVYEIGEKSADSISHLKIDWMVLWAFAKGNALFLNSGTILEVINHHIQT